jgi:predicted CXXCH cytochrome family protein
VNTNKKAWMLCGVVIFALIATVSLAGPGIVGTDHDFSSKGWSSNQICLPCHVPHNALTPEDGPLWNHAESTQTFIMYQTDGQLDGPSKLCLSCHDGVTAVDSFGGNSGTEVIAGNSNIGTDLSDDHPIGMEYPPQGWNTTRYNDPPTTHEVRLVRINDVKRVECVSCHDVHNSKGIDKFLRAPLDESYLCLLCHIK